MRVFYIGLFVFSLMSNGFAMVGIALAAGPENSPGCDKDYGSHIKNFCIVKHGELWRGSQPRGAGAVELMNRGVRTIVNLELLHDDAPHFDQLAVPDVNKLEVEYFRVRDWELNVKLAPTLLDTHVAHFLAITRMRPKPVYVHCRQGQNRTGVMVAAYQVFNGMSIESAIDEMKRYNGLFFQDDARYIRTLTQVRRHQLEKKIEAWIPKLRMQAKIVCKAAACSLRTNPDQ